MKKRVKSFVATSKLTKGKLVKVVVIKEDDKIWVPLMSTNAEQSAVGILESYGVRFEIEEVFKEIWVGKTAGGFLEQENACFCASQGDTANTAERSNKRVA